MSRHSPLRRCCVAPFLLFPLVVISPPPGLTPPAMRHLAPPPPAPGLTPPPGHASSSWSRLLLLVWRLLLLLFVWRLLLSRLFLLVWCLLLSRLFLLIWRLLLLLLLLLLLVFPSSSSSRPWSSSAFPPFSASFHPSRRFPGCHSVSLSSLLSRFSFSWFPVSLWFQGVVLSCWRVRDVNQVKMSHDKRRGSCFITYYRGLPLHGSPLVLVHPQLLRRAMLRRLHPFGKGRGVSGCDLASEGADMMMVEPTSLNRGEGLVARSMG